MEFTHCDVNRRAGLLIFSNTKKFQKAAIALAVIDSMMVEGDIMTIVTIGGAEYTVSEAFWDDASTWWADYLSGNIEIGDAQDVIIKGHDDDG